MVWFPNIRQLYATFIEKFKFVRINCINVVERKFGPISQFGDFCSNFLADSLRSLTAIRTALHNILVFKYVKRCVTIHVLRSSGSSRDLNVTDLALKQIPFFTLQYYFCQ